MTPLPVSPLSSAGTWGRLMTEQEFDFEAMTQQRRVKCGSLIPALSSHPAL